MPMQLQYVQLITAKTNAADLLGVVFTILICYPEEKNTKSIAIPQSTNFATIGKKWRDKEVVRCTL